MPDTPRTKRRGWRDEWYPVPRALAFTGLALHAGPLFLPTTEVHACWGSGVYTLLTILPVPVFGLLSLVVDGVPYLLLLASFFAAQRSYTAAAILAGLALLPPYLFLFLEGGVFLYDVASHRTILGTGLLCWLASSLLMTVAWISAAVQARKARRA